MPYTLVSRLWPMWSGLANARKALASLAGHRSCTSWAARPARWNSWRREIHRC